MSTALNELESLLAPQEPLDELFAGAFRRRLSLTARPEAIAARLPAFASVLNELREYPTCTSPC